MCVCVCVGVQISPPSRNARHLTSPLAQGQVSHQVPNAPYSHILLHPHLFFSLSLSPYSTLPPSLPLSLLYSLPLSPSPSPSLSLSLPPPLSLSLSPSPSLNSHRSPPLSNLKLNCLAAACSALSSLCDPCDESFVRLLALALLRVRTPHLLAQVRAATPPHLPPQPPSPPPTLPPPPLPPC